MVDRHAMRSLLEKMERRAEEALRKDPAFFEAIVALKREIDNDPLVQSRVSELQAAGRSVFNSFVPHVKIRVRTEEGIFALRGPDYATAVPVTDRIGRLTLELRGAASAVIKRGRPYRELNTIVNEAVGSSDSFEGIVSEVESVGWEVLICLDLSAYVQVRGSTPGRPQGQETIRFCNDDLKFLKALRIRIDDE